MAFYGKFSAILTQWDFLQDFVNGTRRLQEALEIDEFLHVGMEVGLLLNGFADLQEKLLVDQLFDAANGEMRHKVLSVAKVAQIVKSVQKVGFEVKQGLRLVVHAEPEDTRHIVAATEARTVKVHGERLVFFGHLLAGLNDVGDVLRRCVADKLQSQMYLVGLHIVDVLLMLEVFL